MDVARSFTAATVAGIAAGHWQLALEVSSAMSLGA